MAIITIVTPFNIDLEFKVADFSKRMLAWLVDIMVICAYYYLMMAVIYPLLQLETGVGTLAGLFVLTLPVMIYQLSCEIFLNGQTIGKKVLGIKVMDREGNEPSWGQYVIRWLLCIGNMVIYIMPRYLIQNPWTIIGFMVLYIPDTIVMLISAKNQRIGDLAAGTVVIDSRYVANIDETIYKEIEVADYKPMFPEVMRLTDRDINGIRNLLSINKTSRETDNYVNQVVGKIKKVLGVETPLDGYDFLQQLLYDYNYLAAKG